MNENRLILPLAHAVQTDDWADRLADLTGACSTAFARDEARYLRAFHALLRAAPSAELIAGLAIPDAARFGALIVASACDSAALSLLGASCGYMLSRGNEGEHMASVILPGQIEECTASGDSLALALVAALATALGTLPVLAETSGLAARRPALRLN